MTMRPGLPQPGSRITGAMLVESSAPVRICDLGGWTDTWFGGPGRVLNVAVTPGVHVSVRAVPSRRDVVLHVDNYGDRYALTPGVARTARHRLLEAAIDELPPPEGMGVEISVRSDVPPGCGTGTSAAVAVALLGALAALRGGGLSRREAAYAAFRLEVDRLGGESGIQDQLSVALGGVNYLAIDAFPEASVTPMPPWEGLDRLLTLVYLGRAHESSAVHRQVIADSAGSGAAALARLREAAATARDAVERRDLAAFGQAMIVNTEAQRALHPALVGVDARRVIEAAAGLGAVGWKVNGAGGDGGSVTLLSATESARRVLESRIAAIDPVFRLIRVQVCPAGLQVVRHS